MAKSVNFTIDLCTERMFRKQAIRKEEQRSVEVGDKKCGLFEYLI